MVFILIKCGNNDVSVSKPPTRSSEAEVGANRRSWISPSQAAHADDSRRGQFWKGIRLVAVNFISSSLRVRARNPLKHGKISSVYITRNQFLAAARKIVHWSVICVKLIARTHRLGRRGGHLILLRARTLALVSLAEPMNCWWARASAHHRLHQ